MRRPEHDLMPGIPLLIVGIVLFTAATIAWGKRPVSAIVAQAAHDYAPAGWPAQPTFRAVLGAIIAQESSDCRHLVGDHGHSFGCAQMRLATAAKMAGGAVPYWLLMMNHSVAIRLGAAYLAYCYDTFGAVGRAVRCYNAGPGGTRGLTSAALRRDPYVSAVLSRARVTKRPERSTVSAAANE